MSGRIQLSALSWRDRFTLGVRALRGRDLSIDPGTVGGRLLAGVTAPMGNPPVRSVGDYLQAYSTMPWLRAVASRIGYDVGAVQWELLVARKKGQRATQNRRIQRAFGAERSALIRRGLAEGELETIDDHPMLDLLNQPNPFQSGL